MGDIHIHRLWVGSLLLIASIWAITQDIDRYAVVAVGVLGTLVLITSYSGND